ncbi:Indoleamine 2,3-dioxygenase [Dipodascopsis tothii]|uniref:Indoleamine 2,3-dioxygenase n=1 Tax=Dipodascopsis tothii TaxID=44089 RepID=UPI0034CD8B38
MLPDRTAAAAAAAHGLPAIPDPRDYDISPVTGFVPEEFPLTHLPDAHYAPWESVMTNLTPLIMTRQVRAVVDRMPLLRTDRLRTPPELRRAYSILGFMAHAYVWAGDAPESDLPTQIAAPLLELAKKLEVPPLATYAGLCLWNHRPIFADLDPRDIDLDALATIHTFTGSYDESWFYLVSTVIECRGAECINCAVDAMAACRAGDSHSAVVALQHLAEHVDELTTLLNRLYDQCDPHVFYYRIRPFLAGSKNMADAGLPQGVRYGDEPEHRQYAGGSNAQSSLVQALDIALGVVHRPTGERADAAADEKRHNNFIHEMRQYMPGPHRRFLEQLALAANIHDYVKAHPSNSALALAYDAALAMLRSFRDKHIQIVSRYIILQARGSGAADAAAPAKPAGTGIAGIALTEKKKARGTGGTALIPFLKQARDETGEPAAGSWGRRLLRDDAGSGRRRRRNYNDPYAQMAFGSDDEDDAVVGLAGKWSMSEDYGGICHW